MFVANERICEGRSRRGARPVIPPCFNIPGQLDLYAADSGAYGFTHWRTAAARGTGRGCTIACRSRRELYTVTANFGDNAPPSVALTAPGGGYVRGAVTVAADASDNFGVSRVELSLGGATQNATGAPFAATFDSAQLPDGPASATARATDVNGHASATASHDGHGRQHGADARRQRPLEPDLRPRLDPGVGPGGGRRHVRRRSLQCSLVPAGKAASFRACSTPTVEIADNQPPGAYRFTARVTDDAGNVVEADARHHDRRHARGRGRRQRRQAARQRRQRLGAGALSVLPVTLSYGFDAKRRGTRFSALTLKRIPSGATVSVTCAKGCPRKAYKHAKPKSTFSVKPYLRRWLKPGAVLTVTVSKPGAMTVIKRFTIRRSKRPLLESLCQAPEAKKPQRC